MPETVFPYGVQRLPDTMEMRFKKRFSKPRRFLLYAAAEKRCPVRVPLAVRKRAWRAGFTTLSYLLYQLDRNNSGQYVRDFDDLNYRLTYPGAASVNDKLNFSHNLKLLTLHGPAVFGVIRHGTVLSENGDAPRIELGSWLREMLHEQGRLALKPVYGKAGYGIFFLSLENGEMRVNSVPAGTKEVLRLLDGDTPYLVTAFVSQAPYAEAMYPKATNTVRVLTLWDRDENSPFVAAAAHRIGTRASEPLDNFHGGIGGISAEIDIGSGLVGAGRRLDPSGRLAIWERHPETGAAIKGVRIPFWEEIKTRVLKAARHFAGSPYVGWDLVATRDGCCFLEGNSPPGVAVWQVHKPLLADPRIRRFYREEVR